MKSIEKMGGERECVCVWLSSDIFNLWMKLARKTTAAWSLIKHENGRV